MRHHMTLFVGYRGKRPGTGITVVLSQRRKMGSGKMDLENMRKLSENFSLSYNETYFKVIFGVHPLPAFIALIAKRSVVALLHVPPENHPNLSLLSNLATKLTHFR
jgi:hypothetical protein